MHCTTYNNIPQTPSQVTSMSKGGRVGSALCYGNKDASPALLRREQGAAERRWDEGAKSLDVFAKDRFTDLFLLVWAR